MEEEGAVAAAEEAQIRVVRCPKCEKFLPELPNYSVYICGGCGATLQAKKKNPASEASSEKSDGENIKYLEVLESVPEKKGAVSEAISRSSQEEEAKRVETSREVRSMVNKMASSHSNSIPGCEYNGIPSEPSVPNLDGPLREDGQESREAKYRWIRKEGKGEMKQPMEARDQSPRALIESILQNAYPGEGPSDYHLRPRYRHANSEHADGGNLDGPSRVSGLEKDRAELLRMLDELRNQVQRSCEITDKPSGSSTASRVADPSSSYSRRDGLNRLRQGSPVLNRNASRHSPYSNGHNASIANTYASVPVQPDVYGYAEPIAHTRAPSYPPGPYPWRNFDNYFFGQCDPDPLVSYHHEGFYHQPACSCVHCYHREFSLPVHGAAPAFNHRRAPFLMNAHGVYPVDGPMIFGPQCYHLRGNTLQRNHQRTMLSKKPRQTCEPMAGGAPFTICYNCHEVLQLPKRSPLFAKNEFKLRCGSCSHAIVVKLDGSRLDVSAPVPTSHISSDSNNSNDSPRSDEHTTDDRLLPPYSFSTGSHEAREKDLLLNSSESEKVQGVSTSSSMSEDELSPTMSNSHKDVRQSRELPPEAEVISRVPSLPLHEHFGYSSSDKVVDGCGKGSRSARSEQEKVVLLAESFKQNSVKDVPVASEMQSPDSEYEDPDLSQDSFDVGQDLDHPRATKGGDSFFSNLIKKSFRINNSMSNGRTRVLINGYPISDRAVRKAEKLAGPIYPGDYWYDYRAGFWGIMGQSCLGMIPPFIQEFNYPIPKNCAGGNTGVLVNGRELHQKDLDLLVGRGLPDSPGRSYRIEISGKVWDEVSGEELYGLGKLAPTVEKMKRGFGMRIPRVIQ